MVASLFLRKSILFHLFSNLVRLLSRTERVQMIYRHLKKVPLEIITLLSPNAFCQVRLSDPIQYWPGAAYLINPQSGGRNLPKSGVQKPEMPTQSCRETFGDL